MNIVIGFHCPCTSYQKLVWLVHEFTQNKFFFTDWCCFNYFNHMNSHLVSAIYQTHCWRELLYKHSRMSTLSESSHNASAGMPEWTEGREGILFKRALSYLKNILEWFSDIQTNWNLIIVVAGIIVVRGNKLWLLKKEKLFLSHITYCSTLKDEKYQN